MLETPHDAPVGSSLEWEAARKRVERRRKFGRDAAAYVAINAFLIVIWAFTGAGYFWPGWVLAGWGIALVLDAWSVFGQKPVTTDDIRREMERGR